MTAEERQQKAVALPQALDLIFRNLQTLPRSVQDHGLLAQSFNLVREFAELGKDAPLGGQTLGQPLDAGIPAAPPVTPAAPTAPIA